MRTVIILIIIIFLVAIIYLFTKPPEDITLKDMLKFNPPALSVLTSASDSVPPERAASDTIYNSVSAFYIIIGSSRNHELSVKQAEKLKKELRANIFVLPPSKEGIYRVSYGRYTTIEEARESLTKIRSMSLSGAWIFALQK